jgi:hypothetical protein
MCQGALSVYTVVEADEGDMNVPNPEPVDAVINAFGKAKRADQVHRLAPDGRAL